MQESLAQESVRQVEGNLKKAQDALRAIRVEFMDGRVETFESATYYLSPTLLEVCVPGWSLVFPLVNIRVFDVGD